MEKLTKLRSFLIGETSLLIQCGEILLEGGHKICGVISSHSAIQNWAKDKKIPCIQTKKEIIPFLTKESFDCLFSIVNQLILPPEAFNLPLKYAINYHDAPLPKYAGTHATSWALMNRESRHAVSWHLVNEKIDGGDILKQGIIEIEEKETAFSLNLKCYDAAIKMFHELIDELAQGKETLIRQNLEERTYFPLYKRPHAACVVSWDQDAQKMEAQVRALNFGDHPNELGLSKLAIDDDFLAIAETEILESMSDTKPGSITKIEENAIHVSSLTNQISLKSLFTLEGKKIEIQEFAEKYNLKEGSRLKNPEKGVLDAITALNNAYCRHEQYWVKELSRMTPVTLPYSGNTEEKRKEYNFVEMSLPREFRQFLEDRPEMEQEELILASFMIYLARLTGMSSFCIGFSESSFLEEIKGLENLFSPNVPFNIDVNGEDGLRKVLEISKKFRTNLLKRKTFIRDVFSRYPALSSRKKDNIFPVSVQIVEVPEERQEISENQLAFIIPKKGKACFLQYCSQYIADEAVEQIQTHLQNILKNPDRKISQAQLLTEEEKARLIQWGQFQTDAKKPVEPGITAPFKDRTIVDLFQEQVEKTPDNIAVVFEGEEMSYRELNRKANQLAHHLRSLGVGPEVPVGIILRRSSWWIVSMLAVLKAGGAYLPVDPDLPTSRRSFILNDAGAPLILTQRGLASDLTELPIRQVFPIEDERQWSRCSPANPESEVTPENLAYIIYTSGSTGQPKGLSGNHQGLGYLARVVHQAHSITAEDRVLQFASFSFDASLWDLCLAFPKGARICLASEEERRSLSGLADLMSRESVTFATLTPAVLQGLDPSRVPDLRQLVSTADACTTEIVNRWAPHCHFFNGYGPTEAVVATSVGECFPGERKPHIGQPLPGKRLYVLDNFLQLTPVGVAGELFIGGDGLARSYLRQPALTASRFLPDPFSDQPGSRMYRTGDLVRHLPDGNLDFLGRVDHQVKVRGFRIELGEIEALLRRHEAIGESAVITDGEGPDKRLLAYLVPTKNMEPPTTEALRRFLGESLPDYMIPSAFVTLEKLPLSSNLKLDREALPKPKASYTPPRSNAEKMLAAIWREALGIDRAIGIHERFFELGGHSLLATRVISRIRKAFGVEVSLNLLFEKTTIADLAPCLGDVASERPPLTPADRSGPLPLSFAQERLWFLNQLAPDSAFYNTPLSIVIKGSLDIKALNRAFTELIRRHEILRTSLVSREGKPSQVVKPAQSIEIPILSLPLQGEEGDRPYHEILKTEAEKVFDLSQAPLMRVTLLRRSPQDHVLLLTFHHIIFDGWSMGVFSQEIEALYKSYAKGESSPLPELAVQYADFAVWQRQWLRGAIWDRQMGYWKEQLKDLPVLAMPTARPRPAQATYHGAPCDFRIDKDLTAALIKLGDASQSTLFMTLLAGLSILLSRYTGQRDIVVGSPVANRNSREVEPLIGFFVNTLVLRVDLRPSAGGLNFSQLFSRVRTLALEAYANQDIPFEQLVEELQPERDMSRNPLVQVAFALQNAPMKDLQFFGLETGPAETGVTMVRMDIEFHLFPQGQGIKGLILYNTDLFDADFINGLAGHFIQLLRTMTEDPEQDVNHAPMLGEEEREKLIRCWNKTTTPQFPFPCIHQLVADHAIQDPDRTAIIYEGTSLSYAQLNQQADGLAYRLVTLGLKPENPVGICLERSPEFVISVLAVLKAGGVYLPLDPAYPSKRIDYILEDTGCSLVITGTDPLRDQRFPDKVVVLNLDQDRSYLKNTRLFPTEHFSPERLAYIIYTSGSTGLPKGVMIPHGGLVNLALFEGERLDIQPESRIAQAASVQFDASVFEIMWAWGRGAALCLGSREQLSPGSNLAAWCREHAVTHLFLTPSAMAVMPVDGMPTVRTLVTGGEACSAELIATFAPGRSFFNAYGPTEVTVCATQSQALEAGQPPDMGLPINNMRVYVLDKFLQPVPVGVPGELFVSSPGLARGYLGLPDLTAQSFIPDPFASQPGQRLYRTGDLVRRLPGKGSESGPLLFMGRIDDQVKIRGFRIEPDEIRACLQHSPFVNNAAVIVREDHPGDKRLTAYVTLTSEEGTASESELAEKVSSQISSWNDIFEQVYQSESKNKNLDFDTVGWNSSYDSRAIPQEQMRVWVNDFVDQVRSLKPRHALEIGCGTGMILFPVAPHCESYQGWDISETSLKQVAKQVRLKGWSHVSLERRMAHELDGLEENSLDMILLNSVIQYFPSFDYLVRVIEGCVRAVKPGGSILLGDLRHYGLMRVFHSSIATFQAQSTATSKELVGRVSREMASETELYIDPLLFYTLRNRIKKIGNVSLRLQRGRERNEMNIFRYTAVLYLGEQKLQEIPELCPEKDLSGVESYLKQKRPQSLCMRGLPNARIQDHILGDRLLHEPQRPKSVGELRRLIDRFPTEHDDISPEDLWELAEAEGYRADLFLSPDDPGCFDAILIAKSAKGKDPEQSLLRFPPFPVNLPVDESQHIVCNSPLQAKQIPQRVTQLKEFLRERLPDYMIPPSFVVLDNLPLTPSGKLDHSLLPPPETGLAGYTGPRDSVEARLASIWRETLGIEKISVHDDFFDLGGHSLLATRVISRIREVFPVDLPLKYLFESPTIAALGKILKQQQASVATSKIRPQIRGERPPLSFAQQRLWFLNSLHGPGHAYNIATAWRLSGNVDIAALTWAARQIVTRHEALRTFFDQRDGVPFQIIDPEPNFDLIEVSLEEQNPQSQETLIEKMMREEVRFVFDLTKGPLLRITLVRLNKATHVLMLTIHHIVADGWSLQIWMREFKTLYAAYKEKQSDPLEPLMIQYADFASWQRQWLSGEALAKQSSYWRERLEGLPELLTLPLDRPRPRIQSQRGGKVDIKIDSALSQQLKRRSHESGATLFMTLLAAYALLLSRYSGQKALGIGIPIANRNRKEIEPLIGFFVNTLVIHIDLSGDMTFRDLLERIRVLTLEAYAHQDLPYEKLVEERQSTRDLSYNPLYQVMFTFDQSALEESAGLPGVTFEALSTDEAVARTDLDLYLWEKSEGLDGFFCFSSDIFERSSIVNLSDRFSFLLQDLVTKPDLPIHRLNLQERPRLPILSQSLSPLSPEESYPLSFHQERIWFIDSFETGHVYESSPIYHNLPLVLLIEEPIDRQTLVECFRDQIERHSILRTAITEEKGVPRQNIRPTPDIELKHLFAEDLPEALAKAREEACQPFDLRRESPIRALIVSLEDSRELLVVTVHHLVADPYSLELLAAELTEDYRERKTKGASLSVDSPSQYTSYALAQRSLPDSAFEPLLFPWKGQLSGKLAVLELPAIRSRPAIHTYQGDSVTTRLTPSLISEIRGLADRQSVGLDAVMLTVFKVLLHRYSSEDEIVIGFCDTGGRQEGTETMIGPLDNLLPLRDDLGGNPSFDALLREISYTLDQARAHSDMPFDKLVLELAPETDMSRTALFDVLLRVIDREPSEYRLTCSSATQIDLNLGLGKYDFNLLLRRDKEDEFVATLVYNTDLYHPSTASRMMSHFETLLQAVVRYPQANIDNLPLLTEEQRNCQLTTWNGPQADYDEHHLIHHHFREQVRLNADKVALVCGDVRITYDELGRKTSQLARLLQEEGVKPDTLVGVCLERSPDLIISMLAILQAGGAYLPMDPDYPNDRLEFMLKDAKLLYLVTYSEQARRFEVDIPHLILLDQRQRDLDNLPAEAPDAPGRLDQLAYCIYTSGSTGNPKGSLITHRNVIRLLKNDRQLFDFNDRDVWTMFHSPSFDFSVWEMYGALLFGGKLVIVPREIAIDPELFGQMLHREKVTILNQVPSAFYQLAAVHERPPESLRHVIFGGEALQPSRLTSWRKHSPSLTFVNMYGITETCVHVTFREVSQQDMVENNNNIGSPIPTTTAYILDRYGALLPVGVIGELYVGGSGLSRGYLGRPELTAERFVPDHLSGEAGARLYRTGDLARYLPDGNMEHLGRLDAQVKVRGFRIELAEIEVTLGLHPLLEEAVVLTRPDASGNLNLEAWSVPRAETSVTGYQLRQYLNNKLPAYMVPPLIHVIDRLPRTPSGKLDRSALLSLSTPLVRDSSTMTRSLTPTEEIIARVWSQILAADEISGEDHFFERGGHSLLATQVISRLRQVFEVDLPIKLLFETPKLDEFARQIDSAKKSKTGVFPPPQPLPRTAAIPLSFSQQRLWFIDQFSPNSVYNMPGAIRFSGSLDVTALERSFARIVERHEILRTRFPNGEKDQPVQEILPVSDFSLPVTSLESFPPEDRTARFEHLRQEEANALFDLGSAPALRVKLIRLDETTHILLVTMHHIICDGWSTDVLLRELRILYTECLQAEDFHEKSSALSDLPIQYADFSDWQRRKLESDLFRIQLDYWKKQLSGAPTLLSLPTDRPRPDVQSFRGDLYWFRLDSSLVRELKTLGQATESTLFMILITGFALLLSRYSGQRDLVIGSAVANRNQAELEPLIGCFVNMLALRFDLREDEAVTDLLARVRRVCLDAYSHQDIPFERLVEELLPERNLGHTPIFQSVFVLNKPAPNSEWPGLRLELLDPPCIGARFDLSLSLNEIGEDLTGSLEYSSDLFDRETIVRMMDHYQNLLSRLSAGLKRSPFQLDLLGAEDYRLLRTWNDTQQKLSGSQFFPLLVKKQAAATPHHIAVSCLEETLTYAQLDQWSDKLACLLHEKGIYGKVVGLLLPRSIEMIVAILGIFKAGGAYMPLESSQPPERRLYMLAETGAELVITSSALRVELPSSLAVLYVDDAKVRDDEEIHSPEVSVLQEDLAYVLFTSGSTGRPKGVMISHGSLCGRLCGLQKIFPLRETDRFLHHSSPGFDCSVLEVFLPLLSGAQLVLQPFESGSVDLISFMEQQRITGTCFVPSLLSLYLTEESFGRLEDLRLIVVGGEVLTPALHRSVLRRSKARLVNNYGPTEVCVQVTTWESPKERSDGIIPIGRPMDNTEIHILDSFGQPVPIGVAGELYLGGVGLARGYVGQPGLTASRFVPNPFSPELGSRLYRSGDLGRYLPDGNIQFLGRVDDQVKIRGLRIEPGEVEQVLIEQSDVAEAAVVVREDQTGEPCLVAYIVPRESVKGETMMNSWKEGLRRHLPEYMTPAFYVYLESMPRTSSGKIARNQLPEPDQWNQAKERDLFHAPQTLTEETLADIWQEVLGSPRLSRLDNFFDLGGHSLMATRAVSLIRRRFNIELPLRALFETPKLKDLARRIESVLREGLPVAPPIKAMPRGERLPLSFAQERLWFLDQLIGSDATYIIPSAISLKGTLNVEALEQSLTEIVCRHESLRTNFISVDGRPEQVIRPEGSFPLPVIDLSQSEDRDSALRQYLRRNASEPFDLTRDSLIRAFLLRLDSHEFVLLLTLHHIIFDGWSIGVLLRELSLLYNAFAAGEPSPLDELHVQYADFAVWQRNWLQGKVLSDQLAYWKKQLADPIPLELPTDRSRPEIQTFKGSFEELKISPQFTQELKDFGREEGATLYMTLVTAFGALLSRYSGQEDLMVGYPIANRNHTEIEPLLGFFVNTLALRFDLSGNPSFRELLARVRDTALESYNHQDLPFEQLVEALQPERDTSRNPLIQTLFALQNADRSRLDLTDLTSSLLDPVSPQVRFDLEIHFSEYEDGLIGLFGYHSDLFDAESIVSLTRHYHALLREAVDQPDKPISELSMLDEEEKRRLLEEWNPRGNREPHLSLEAEFEAQAAAFPERPAILYSKDRLDYGQLNERVNQLAHYLRGFGVGPGVLVGVCMERVPEMVICLLAILKAGGAYVPLDPTYPKQRLAFILEDTELSLAITLSDRHADLFEGNIKLICLQRDDAIIRKERKDNPGLVVNGEHLAYVIHTSGSSGKPKGVAIRRSSVSALISWAKEIFTPEDLRGVLAGTSICFDLSVFELFVTLAAGGKVILANNALALPNLPARDSVTLINSVPSAVKELVALQAIPASTRIVNLAGEALASDLVESLYAIDTIRAVYNLWLFRNLLQT